jgi:hypothetical protein
MIHLLTLATIHIKQQYLPFIKSCFERQAETGDEKARMKASAIFVIICNLSQIFGQNVQYVLVHT